MRRLVTTAFVAVVGLLLLVAIGNGVADRSEAPAPMAPKLDGMDLGLSPGASILDLDDDELSADLQRAADLGFTHLRLDFDWSRIQSADRSYDWSKTDRVVDAAAAVDISIHALLVYTPRWARPDGSSDKHPPVDLDDFGAFAAESTARYGPRGVASWEIWNEPNSALFWSSAEGPNPEAFAAMVSLLSAEIRRIDADAIIVSGGLAPGVDDPGSELSPEAFLERFLPELEPGAIDAVAIHPYSFPALPADDSKPWNLFGRLPGIHQLVAEVTGEDLPIWITEFGAPTGDSDRSVSLGRQERIVLESLGCANRTPWIEAFYVYNLRDRVGGDSDDMEDNFGLFLADGDPKPAATAVGEFQSLRPGDPIPAPCTDW